MNNFFILGEIHSNRHITEVLDVIVLIAILCATLAIISKNPIFSILFLTGLFICIISYFSIFSLNFFDIYYSLVYMATILLLISVFILKHIFDLTRSKPHVFVSLPVESCIHIPGAITCTLCSLQPYFNLDLKANCTHNFARIVVKSTNLGVLCDFDGGTHMAANNVDSIVRACSMCNAVVCSGCFTG